MPAIPHMLDTRFESRDPFESGTSRARADGAKRRDAHGPSVEQARCHGFSGELGLSASVLWKRTGAPTAAGGEVAIRYRAGVVLGTRTSTLITDELIAV